MSTAGNLLRGSLFRTLDLAVAAAAGLFITPYLVRAVGDRVYGFWTLVAAFIGYYGLLDVGLSSAAARYLSQALGRGESAELDRVAGTAMALFIAIGVLVWALAAASALACPLFVRDPSEAAVFRTLMLIMGATAAVAFPIKVYTGMLTAGIRYDVLSAASIARSLLCNGGIYACLKLGHGIVAVAWVTFAANAVQHAATYAAFKALYPKVAASAFACDAARVRALLRYGGQTLLCQLGDVMRFRLDTVLIATFLTASLVTPYAVGARVVQAFVQLIFGSVGMMLPVFSQYEGRGDYGAIKEALLKSTKLTTILSTYVGLSVIFYGRAFMRRWMGPGFDSAYVVTAILSAGYLIELPQTPGIQLLYGLSQQRFYAILGLWEGAANVALSVWLLRRYGIYGVALGTSIAFAFFKLFVQPFYICRVVQLSTGTYLRTIAATLVKAGAPLAVYFLIVARWVAPSYASLAGAAGAQTVVFVPIAYFLIMGAGERRAVREALAAAAFGRKERRLLSVSVEP